MFICMYRLFIEIMDSCSARANAYREREICCNVLASTIILDSHHLFFFPSSLAFFFFPLSFGFPFSMGIYIFITLSQKNLNDILLGIYWATDFFKWGVFTGFWIFFLLPGEDTRRFLRRYFWAINLMHFFLCHLQPVDKKPRIPESEILTTGTEDEEASSAPERVSVQKNLRFFGDTDQESLSSNRERRSEYIWLLNIFVLFWNLRFFTVLNCKGDFFECPNILESRHAPTRLCIRNKLFSNLVKKKKIIRNWK